MIEKIWKSRTIFKESSEIRLLPLARSFDHQRHLWSFEATTQMKQESPETPSGLILNAISDHLTQLNKWSRNPQKPPRLDCNAISDHL